MHDILKQISHEQDPLGDPDGWKLESPEWSEEIAIEIATAEGIFMTPTHWQAVYALREDFFQHGPRHHSRDLRKVLDAEFAYHGGRRVLHQLFPGGPIHQASRIAGLPVPPDSSDMSFGYVQ